jgi:phage pi2 protein 07
VKYSTWQLKTTKFGNYILEHSDLEGDRVELVALENRTPMVNIECGWVHYPTGEDNKEKYKQILLDACQKLFDDELKKLEDLQNKFKIFRGEQCQELKK